MAVKRPLFFIGVLLFSQTVLATQTQEVVVDSMGRSFLSQNSEGPEAEEVRYLKALAVLEMGRREEGLAELERLSRESASIDVRKKAGESLQKALQKA